MQIAFCGVRGSTPAPGAEFTRVGGHTSCVALRAAAGHPMLVLDGGTGLRNLARHLGPAPFVGTVLLSHLHWDHTHGLPFFPAAAHPQSRVAVLMPSQGDPTDVLARAFGPPHFPLRPEELRGAWTFGGLETGEHDVEGFTVTAVEIPHLGGRTFGFRVSDGVRSVAYLSDHMPHQLGPGPDGVGEYHDAAMVLARGADLLVHDAQLTADELAARGFLGHAAAEYAVELARRAGVGRLALFHHDPERTDDEVDALEARLTTDELDVTAAREGGWFPV